MWSEALSFTLVAFSAIFFIVDPIAAVPIFIVMTEHDSIEKRRSMAKRACLVTAGVLTFFALGGGVLFKMFGVTLPAFKIAGGILLIINALDMLSNHTSATKTSPDEIDEAARKDDIAIVPLAMPLLAGPGAIATVMVLAAETKHLWELAPIVASILVTATVAYLMLRGADLTNRVLGRNGRAILGRVMGLMLCAIAVQFIVTGVREALPEIFAHAH